MTVLQVLGIHPYKLGSFEDYILTFAKKRYELGYKVINNGATATGIDLTESAVALARELLELNQGNPQNYEHCVADAENLSFDDGHFDLVYSFGVLHHTTNTEVAFKEAFRVLKPCGTLNLIVYHIPPWAGWILWIQHALLKGKPFQSRALDIPRTMV